ncbi:MAG: LuxR C-terminal-related transcriptional regulator [Thermomicrobiales bacterium]
MERDTADCAPEPVPHEGLIPVARTRLIGRATESVRARELLLERGAPLLTLTGPGGSGKTRLAQSLAAELATNPVDGVAWVDLAPLADPALVPLTVAQALGLTPVPGLEVAAQLIAALQARQTIIFLDNCEHIIEGVATLVAAWLPACPGVQIVATSRSPLRLRGERELPVEPLPLPHVDATTETLMQNDAVQLFAERAEAVNPRFVLDAGNVREVAAICRALDGLPLAIELAAARTRVLSLGILQHQMSDRLSVLQGGARDLPARQRTISDTIAWSYTLLTPSQQACFRRLGVFSGGWTLPAAVAVASTDATAASGTLADLTALVDQSLVRRDYNAADLRFTMLETIREFALRELAAHAENAPARERHACWYRDLVEQLDLHHARQGDTDRTRGLLPEQDNLRQALTWFAETGDALSLCRLSAALAKFWFDLGQFGEARHWLQLAIASDDGVDVLTQARAWNRAAWLAMCQGELDAASALRETGLSLAREAGESFLLAESDFEAGILAFWQGDLPRAKASIEAAQRALAVIEAEFSTAPIKRCATVNLLGGIALIAGDVGLAVSHGETAVVMARALGASTDLGYSLCGLGYAYFQQGGFPEAAACFLESLAICWGQQNLAFLPRLEWAFAALALRAQRAELAGLLIGAADALDARTGSAMWPNDRALADWCLTHLARLDTDESLGRLREQGRALPVEQPIAVMHQLGVALLGARSAAVIWERGHGPALTPAVRDRPGKSSGRMSDQAKGSASSVARLTERELAVLMQLVEGRTDREIAATLFISRRTVSKHLEAIFAKLGVHTRGAAAAEAQRLGIAATPFLNEPESAITAD